MIEPSASGSSDGASGGASDGASDAPLFSPEELTRFAHLFTAFVSSMQSHADAHTTRAVAEAVGAHLGVDADSRVGADGGSGSGGSRGPAGAGGAGEFAGALEPVRSAYPHWRWADVDLALETVLPGEMSGVVGGHSEGLGEILEDVYGNFRLGAVQRTTFPSDHDEVRYVATNALRFSSFDGEPVVAYAHAEESLGESSDVQVEVLAADPARARAVLAVLDEAIVRGSGLRGRIVSFAAPSQYGGDENPSLVFHERPTLTAEDVVLPDGRLERIRATVLGMSENAAHLRAAGQHLSRGVLLYGQPGTGKTHTVRYLLADSPETTAFVLQGSSLGLIRQAAETARQLQPAIIVLEDADLVAADRDFGEGDRPILLEILDVMDGLDDDADLAFVLTTNRVDVLEEALALRPGRIDLAVRIPLPTQELRARLFARSSRELPITAAGCEAAAALAVGTTGSFPKEAVRRAVLDALADGHPVDDARLVAAVLALRDEGVCLRAAMEEMHVEERAAEEFAAEEFGSEELDSEEFGSEVFGSEYGDEDAEFPEGCKTSGGVGDRFEAGFGTVGEDDGAGGESGDDSNGAAVAEPADARGRGVNPSSVELSPEELAELDADGLSGDGLLDLDLDDDD